MTQKFENIGKGKITGYILVAAAIATITGFSLKDFWINTNNDTDIGQREIITSQSSIVKSVKDDNNGKFEEDTIEYVCIDILGIAIAKKDVSEEKLIWQDADNLCKNSILGGHKNWRLPTIDELATLFQNKNSIGGFSNSVYWSSTVSHTDLFGFYMKNIYMGSGELVSINNKLRCNCRCVRTLPHREIKE